MPPEEPRLRSYNERLLHKAAVQAMAALIQAHPDWNSTAIAGWAVDQAQALVKELSFIEISEND
ncbi:hypothetical protein IQ265_00735 [Nodosilinea sp. LEGE 06152]|uniref:hypothetical protein n=1 Tax=Nodosilinea sp. LEGE 06152 TaxID=2777966 RepID=UPI00187F7DCB|nr:hypothetical protein [Nodosilinea sp. LEGE 06152]MBE9155373.1 hypothetical protein [Nodosilinea sp. LEGE 06152]